MASSLFVNALQFEFDSMLAMEHTGMDSMFKTLVDTWLEGFLAASGSVYEADVVEFFVNAKVFTETIVSFVANRNMAITKDVFAAALGCQPREWSPSKKKEMNMEFRLLHDIVANALCAKAGSFDMVTSEKFDLMVAISAGLKVNWAPILFQVLVNMVNNTTQPQGIFHEQNLLVETIAANCDDGGGSVGRRERRRGEYVENFSLGVFQMNTP
ncbi:hypothetical protein F511_24058 [Dorcoceras hygrometricum]|uniref:Uncharacterized protein n=1 Tax=Dorcoceras hygrometricum TaxID=472368 RepID=A0A2Z7CPN2_9LAMI|nr:hypothetical protein F511_24058 [Dorcoceras hygrometricum]